ncbi:MAG: ribonuclease Z [Prevotella sp.]|nr:ribonuclease Z [Prevotella sp.]
MEPFRVYILGCGSALPTLRHFPSMQIVECRGKLFMFDCGEGAQSQMRRSGLSFNRMGHVFITHLHGDHCFGLIGMISTFGLLGRTATLNVYAPEALKDMLERQMKMFCRDLGYTVEFHAVDTTRHQIVYEDRSLQVESIPLEHRMPTCGYLLREKPGLPHIRRDIIDAYQIPLSQIGNIKSGADWTALDGTLIANAQLTTPADPPRAYAYCTDTRYLQHLHEELKGVTTLYHESTYANDNLAMAEKYCHSTAEQAACVARDAGVRQLLLGHFSSRYTDESVLLHEAQKVFANTRLTSEMDVIDV